MSTKELLDKVMKLKPEERFSLVDGLIKSLDEPGKKLDEIWPEEAEKRFKAYLVGKLEGITMEKYLKKNDARYIYQKKMGTSKKYIVKYNIFKSQECMY